MKLGGLSPSFRVVMGAQASPDEQKDTVKFLTFNDGSIEIINYGARKEAEAEFTFAQISKTDFVTLVNYLKNNMGVPCEIIEQNATERIFTEVWPYTTYYVTVLEFKQLQEEMFTTTRESFSIRLKVALLGQNSTDHYNSDDSSLIDACIEIDTIQADYIEDDTPGPVAPSEGERWLDTTGSPKVLKKYISAAWIRLYDVMADNATYGFKDGTFYLSAFSKVSIDDPPIAQDYIAGLITNKSIRIDGKSINLNKGAAIAHRTGFSFALKDEDKFWNFINSNQVSIFGAVCTLKLFFNDSGTKYLDTKASGKIKNIQFSYTDYKVKVEPVILGKEAVYPAEKIDAEDARYVGIQENLTDKAPFRTFGQHQHAALQDVSLDQEFVEATNESIEQDVIVIVAAIDYDTVNSDLLPYRILIDKSDYTLTAALIAALGNGEYALQVRKDTKSGSSNPDEVREIDVFEDEPGGYTGFYSIKLRDDDPLPTRPDSDSPPTPPNTLDRIWITIVHSQYRYQMDENDCGGFGSLSEDETEFDSSKLDLFIMDEFNKNLIEIPKTDFIINTEKNMIKLLPQTSGGKTKVTTFEEQSIRHIRKNIITPDPTDDANIDLNLSGWPPGGYNQDHEKMLAQHRGGGPAIESYRAAYSAELAAGGHSGKVFYPLTGLDPISETQFKTKAAYILFKYDSNNENHLAHIFRFHLPHWDEETAFINADDVRLCLDLTFRSIFKISYTKADAGAKDSVWRYKGFGFKIRIRFIDYDGNPIEDDSNWIQTVTQKQLSIIDRDDFLADSTALTRADKVRFDNFPDGDQDGNFRRENTALADNQENQFQYWAADATERDANFPAASTLKGDLCWRVDNGNFDESDGATWTAGAVDPTVDAIQYQRVQDEIGSATKIYKCVAGSPKTLALASASEYNTLPTVKGRNLFDISSLFGATPQWADIDFLELQIINLDSTGDQHNDTGAGFNDWERLWELQMKVNRTFRLVTFQETEVVGKDIFATVQGQKVGAGSTFSSNPVDIISNIMDDMYPNQWDSSSLTTLCAKVTRAGWKFHKQFTRAESVESILLEILKNLWACAVINESDQIEFVSLIPDDHSQGTPLHTFTDSDIVKDTIRPPKFRNLDDIYQEFRLNFDFQPPSQVSNSIPDFDKHHIINKAAGSTLIKRYCEISENIYNILNELEDNFNYHYDGEKLPIAEKVAEWFCLNVWITKFQISLSRIIGGNSIKIMDYAKINSYFHTDSDDTEGFLTYFEPLIYDAVVEVGMHIFRPPGLFGPACDNFNDALTTDRNITGWGSDKKNDAGDTSRVTATYTKKDAGTSPRTIEC